MITARRRLPVQTRLGRIWPCTSRNWPCCRRHRESTRTCKCFSDCLLAAVAAVAAGGGGGAPGEISDGSKAPCNRSSRGLRNTWTYGQSRLRFCSHLRSESCLDSRTLLLRSMARSAQPRCGKLEVYVFRQRQEEFRRSRFGFGAVPPSNPRRLTCCQEKPGPCTGRASFPRGECNEASPDSPQSSGAGELRSRCAEPLLLARHRQRRRLAACLIEF